MRSPYLYFSIDIIAAKGINYSLVLCINILTLYKTLIINDFLITVFCYSIMFLLILSTHFHINLLIFLINESLLKQKYSYLYIIFFIQSIIHVFSIFRYLLFSFQSINFISQNDYLHK